jgi:hypothetical protein
VRGLLAREKRQWREQCHDDDEAAERMQIPDPVLVGSEVDLPL